MCRANYLWVAVSVGGDDCDISFLGIRIVDGDVLLDGQLESLLLRVQGSSRILADVLGLQDMLLDEEDGGRHGGRQCREVDDCGNAGRWGRCKDPHYLYLSRRDGGIMQRLCD